ncbi:MAG: hypothetical protein Q9174_004394 [Haloplaca sp. 1 TL-2023]
MKFLLTKCREAQNQNYFLNTRTEVPLKSEFKPAMQVLSRKPATKTTAAVDPATGVEKLTLEDDEDDEEDEEKKRTPTAEERQIKAQKEREEKQKKYEEARQRLFGANNSQPGSGKASEKNTAPRPRANGDSRGPSRNQASYNSRPSSSSGMGAGVGQAPGPVRQLYDPSYTPQPDSLHDQKKDRTPTNSGRSTPYEQQPIRMPRGPDGSGRGGHGFAPR